MFWKKKKHHGNNDKKGPPYNQDAKVTLEALKQMTSNMADAENVQLQTANAQKVETVYIRTLIDQERFNESVVQPLKSCTSGSVDQCISAAKATKLNTLDEAASQLMAGSVLLHDPKQKQWLAVKLKNPLGRAIESSETETILYGPKDSFSEQFEQNITLIRRRLPLTSLKTEKYIVGTRSKTTVVTMYIEGIINPKVLSIAREKVSNVDYDLILESSNLAVFMEDHEHSVFPQFQQTDRPDMCAYSLGVGKLVILIGNTPFALIAPITFFHLFQSPEDYIHRWIVASFLRLIRYVSFFLSITLIPVYVALNTHHYQMIPLQILFVLMESRSKLPFSPFWEAALMLLTLEIIKEASLRMPTKTGQTLGVIGGIVIGQAAVEAGFASKVLIVLVGISAIASFLVPNYLVSKANTIIQFIFLFFSYLFGILGIALGLVCLLAHLNALTSLKQPYFAPVAPFFLEDWKDFLIRAPLTWLKTRPEHLQPVQKWRYRRRR
ncbi:spore germination protein [Bacillus sp. V33-4]|uniref:spore germination protein n=1 Tax=Bacillus sp. V33-4 TaxID=2054169 RepID=UPI000C78CF1A|nr:spore germination protein [Bacillus sp. V33-4]PLR80598.1 spore germination protein [Bacillus sp. V33-4]